MRKTLLALGMVLAGTSLFADDPEILEIGDPAPDFQLPGVDGKIYSLDSFGDAEVLTLVFTANHCPTAQAYEERMKDLSAAYSPDDMQLVAISSNHPDAVCLEELGYTDLGDSFEDMKIRASESGFNFPYLYDGDTQEVAMAYGAVATPHVFIFDSERKLRYRGRIDEMEDPYQKPEKEDARNAIDALLTGKPVPVESTRAFGCSMKWKSKIDWRKKLDADWAQKEVDLEEIGLEGMKELLENKGEKIMLLNVWATWCGPCVIEFPEFVDMQRMYGQRGFKVVSLSVNRSSQKEEVLNFLNDKQAAISNYLYKEIDREDLFDLIDPQWMGNIPYTMLILPGGEVVFRNSGMVDPLDVRKAIIGQIGRYFADD